MTQSALSTPLATAQVLRDVMECVGDPVTVIGADGCVVMQNAASVAALPNPPPRSFAEWDQGFVLHSADGVHRVPIDEWPLARALRGEDVIADENSVLMPHDPTQPIMLLASARPIRDEAGAIVGAVLISRDVSEQRRLERDLAQAQRLEAVGALAAGVAHDFNNILTAISASAEGLLTDANASERQKEIATRIDGASDRGADLVRRLLAFARQQPLAPNRVDVNPLVRELVALLRPTLSGNIDIIVDLAPCELAVIADASQLQSALLNLAVNARDAMPKGGQLKFHTEPSEDRVLIEVSDTGEGIPFDQQARVFEPFYTTKGAGKGSGLGLAMVYGFAAQTGGDVDLRSAPGAGTAVRMRLPAAS